MGWGGVIPGAPCRTLNVASTVKFFSMSALVLQGGFLGGGSALLLVPLGRLWGGGFVPVMPA